MFYKKNINRPTWGWFLDTLKSFVWIKIVFSHNYVISFMYSPNFSLLLQLQTLLTLWNCLTWPEHIIFVFMHYIFLSIKAHKMISQRVAFVSCTLQPNPSSTRAIHITRFPIKNRNPSIILTFLQNVYFRFGFSVVKLVFDGDSNGIAF